VDFKKFNLKVKPPVKVRKTGIGLLLVLIAAYGCHHHSLPNINRDISSERLEIRAHEILFAALDSSDPTLRVHALESLAQIHNLAAVPKIRPRLYDPIDAVRFAAAIAVGDCKDYAARDLLEILLTDKNVMVRMAAAYALEKMGDRRFFGDWYDVALYSNDAKLSGQACLLLGKLGNNPYRSDSREKLWRVLRKKDQSPAVILQAAEALARLNDEKILKKLLVYAGSIYADDRLLAISGLQHIGGQDVFAMLTVLADDPQIEVRLAAIRALGALAQENDREEVRRSLRYIDEQSDPVATARVRGLAVLALGAIGTEEDTSAFYRSLSDESPYVCVAAARAVNDFFQRIRKKASSEGI